jgi:TPP-dependent indolepyruvate ferredoxin oxidoreductase alpha subunit
MIHPLAEPSLGDDAVNTACSMALSSSVPVTVALSIASNALSAGVRLTAGYKGSASCQVLENCTMVCQTIWWRQVELEKWYATVAADCLSKCYKTRHY